MVTIKLHDEPEAMPAENFTPEYKAQQEKKRIQSRLLEMNGFKIDELDFALHLLSQPRAGFKEFERMYMQGNDIFAMKAGEPVYFGRITDEQLN